MADYTRDFKGVWIPKEVWLNKDITLHEKMFLVEIDSLDNELGCFASNGHFSDFFGVTKGRCSQIINNLIKKKYITVYYEREGKQIIKRTLRVVNKLNRVVNKCEEGIKEMPIGYIENDKGNNTLNNTLNNTYNNIQKDKKHKYGEYKNVLLTDKEKQKLIDKFNGSTELKIKEMDEAIELKGYKYKSHYLAILKWSENRKNNEPKEAKIPWIEEKKRLEREQKGV